MGVAVTLMPSARAAAPRSRRLVVRVHSAAAPSPAPASRSLSLSLSLTSPRPRSVAAIVRSRAPSSLPLGAFVRASSQAVDLYLIHWPGAAWSTMARKKELTDADPFHYALPGHDAASLPALRAEVAIDRVVVMWRVDQDAPCLSKHNCVSRTHAASRVGRDGVARRRE